MRPAWLRTLSATIEREACAWDFASACGGVSGGRSRETSGAMIPVLNFRGTARSQLHGVAVDDPEGGVPGGRVVGGERLFLGDQDPPLRRRPGRHADLASPRRHPSAREPPPP